MQSKDKLQIKCIIQNLESAIENLVDFNNNTDMRFASGDMYKKFQNTITLIKDAKTIAYQLVEAK